MFYDKNGVEVRVPKHIEVSCGKIMAFSMIKKSLAKRNWPSTVREIDEIISSCLKANRAWLEKKANRAWLEKNG